MQNHLLVGTGYGQSGEFCVGTLTDDYVRWMCVGSGQQSVTAAASSIALRFELWAFCIVLVVLCSFALSFKGLHLFALAFSHAAHQIAKQLHSES